MPHTRRGFLSFLGLSGAGFMLARPAKATPKTSVCPTKTTSKVTPSWMVKEVVEVMAAALAARTVHVPSAQGARVGETVDGTLMTAQPYVVFRVSREPDIDEFRFRYADPAGKTLAAAITQRGLTVLSDLPIPNWPVTAARVYSHSRGVSARGVFRDDGVGGYEVTVEVIGGR